MEKLRKVVIITCLIYFLYGLTSWFELGVFVLPFPIKPFLFISFLVGYLSFLDYKKFSLLNLSLIIWLFLSAFIGQHIVETFFSHNTISVYLNTIEPYFFYGANLFFILFIFFLIKDVGYSLFQTLALIFCVVAMAFLSFVIVNNRSLLSLGIVFISFILFVFNYFDKKIILNVEHQKVLLILYGVGIINCMEEMVYIF